MTHNRLAGLALIAGSSAGLVTMALHPTGGDVVTNAAQGGRNVMAVGTHALAIGAIPVLVGGLLTLTRRLETHAGAWFALVAYVFASVSVLIAATASGLITPALMSNYAKADEATRAIIHSQSYYTHMINQAFAKIFVVMSAAAIMLWSVAMRGNNAFGNALRVYGPVAGTAMILGVLSGHLQLEIHGFGAVMIAQGVWMVWTGVALMRMRE
ncbi:MAG: hypothetical protein ACO1Q7_06890 [Gemmatimonas sp.]